VWPYKRQSRQWLSLFRMASRLRECLLFDAFGKGFFGSCGPFLRRRLVARDGSVRRVFFVPAHVKQCSCFYAIDTTAGLALRAFRFLRTRFGICPS
jgi:hypothetical protein